MSLVPDLGISATDVERCCVRRRHPVKSRAFALRCTAYRQPRFFSGHPAYRLWCTCSVRDFKTTHR